MIKIKIYIELFYKNWGIMIECGKIKVSWCFFFVDFCVLPPNPAVSYLLTTLCLCVSVE